MLQLKTEGVVNADRLLNSEAKEGESPYNETTARVGRLLGALGMDSITDENAQEFFRRARLMFVATGNEDYQLSAYDVARHIGLTANVSLTSPQKFLEQVAREMMRGRNNEEWDVLIGDLKNRNAGMPPAQCVTLAAHATEWWDAQRDPGIGDENAAALAALANKGAETRFSKGDKKESKS